MTVSDLASVAVLCSLAMACQHAPETPDLYFGQVRPGDTPEVFAPGVISQDDRFEQFLLYTQDGRALVFGLTNDDWSEFTLQSMRLTEDGWTEPAPPPFTGDDPGGLTSCWSFDGNRTFFTDARPDYPPADVFMSLREGTGWSKPVEVGAPISSDADEFEVACTQSGALYFSSSRSGGYGQLDLYRAPLVDGGYPSADNLGPAINTEAIDDLPYVAPDESYLIFGSNRQGGYGNHDLYISYRIGGAWSAPQNLGPDINTKQFDNYPSVSPDGEYLFFARRSAWTTEEDSDIYWVRAAFIDRLRDSAVVGENQD